MPVSHPSHARPELQPLADELYVLTVLSNPMRWRNRYWNYAMFEREALAAGAQLYVAEVALGDRAFEITQAGNPRHLQLRTQDELWHKENALNLLLARLPAGARYVAWIDADVKFARPDWVQETLHQLQHYQIVQMFSQVQNLGPDFAGRGAFSYGFGYCYLEGLPELAWPGPMTKKTPGFRGYPGPYPDPGPYPYGQGVYWHPGFAWAARKSALDALGGFLDFAILGSGDWHMATALIGQVDKSLWSGYHPNFKRWARQWQERAERYVRRNLGYVPGLLLHAYHGEKANRNYDKRYKLMAAGRYNPERDLKRDWQGLWQLNPENRQLRDAIRRYGRLRREDG
jgi:hypothetical protein